MIKGGINYRKTYPKGHIFVGDSSRMSSYTKSHTGLPVRADKEILKGYIRLRRV